jgi:hypothetical protein
MLLQVRVSVHLHLPDHNVRRHVIDVLKLEHDLHDHHHNHGDHEQGHESEACPERENNQASSHCFPLLVVPHEGADREAGVRRPHRKLGRSLVITYYRSG